MTAAEMAGADRAAGVTGHNDPVANDWAGRLRCHVLTGVGEIPAEVWQRMLGDDPESWAFYRLIEQAPPPGFELGALAVYDEDRPIAVAPYFRVDYRIDTPFQGLARKVGDWLYAHLPRLVSLPVIGLGSPMSDALALGFEPILSHAQRSAAFGCMLEGLMRQARLHRSALVAVKGIGSLIEALQEPLKRNAFNRVTTVPVAVIDLDYASLESYLAALAKKDRAYLLRKQRAAAGVRIEVRTSFAGLEPKLYELFQATLAQSKIDYGDFEQLSPEYFATIGRALEADNQPLAPLVTLFWREEELIGFEFSLVGRNRVLTKHIGMKYPDARALNLYFVSGLRLIEETIRLKRRELELGATTYATKLLFGARLERRWLCFRFRSALLNHLLRPVVPLFDFERNDQELKQLMAQRPNDLFRRSAEPPSGTESP